MMNIGSMRHMAVVGLAMLLAACASTRGGNLPYDVANFGMPDTPKPEPVADIYKLAPLDTVSVLVFQAPDLSRDYMIDQSGHITMPLIGQVAAVGMSTTELGTLLARRLDERYMLNPNVTVTLKESGSRVVTVDGSVQQPGIYPATGPLTLVQSIALARGVSELANPRRVAIFRTIEGKRTGAAFDLKKIRQGQSPDPAVYPGDLIIVDGSGLKKAQRDLLQSLPLTSLLFRF